MADTTFVDGTTIIEASWLNDLNDFYYATFGGTSGGAITVATVQAAIGPITVANGGTGAATAAAARTALDAQEDVITTRGDIIIANSTPAASRLAIGSASKVLTSDGTDPSWTYPKVVQVVEATPITAWTDCSTVIPYDDTIPQKTEGTEVITVSITPKNATNRLRIECDVNQVTSSATQNLTMALFQDTTAGALAAAGLSAAGANYTYSWRLVHEMAAGTTSATTFKINIGGASGNAYLNGTTLARRYGGVCATRLRVTEIA